MGHKESRESDSKSIQSVLTKAKLLIDQDRRPAGGEGEVSGETHGLSDLVLASLPMSWVTAAT